MATEKKTKQPSKRFSKLEAIPGHEPMPFGVKSILAKLYIARKRTLAASAAFLVVACGTIYTLGSVSDREIETAIASAGTPAAEARSEAPTTDPIQKPEVIVSLVKKEAMVSDAGADASLSAFGRSKGDQPSDVAASGPEKAEPAVKHENPVRQIIPIAEGLDLYRQPSSASNAPPHVADQEPADAATDDQEHFALPTVGVPSEDDLSGFLAMPQPSEVSRETGVVAREDLSPTIDLPDAVPLPESRPAPGTAAGQKVEFRIVQGPGIKSGFWIGNKDDATARRFFVIVKPFLDDGTGVNWRFTNIADGSAADTDTMAVEVTEDAFIALAREAKELGSVKDPVLGRGVAGNKNVKWRISSVQGNLLAGWDKEGRK